MQVQVQAGEDSVLVAVTGDIDVLTAPAFRRALTEALTYAHPRIVIDLRDAGCFGSTAINSVIPLARDAAERNIRVELVNPSPLTRRVIDLCQLGELSAVHLQD